MEKQNVGNKKKLNVNPTYFISILKFHEWYLIELILTWTDIKFNKRKIIGR
jgi:hypothetical protein